MNEKLLSIILLSYYSKEKLVKVYHKVKLTLSEANIPFELIIVDDGSKDNSIDFARKLEQDFDNVRAYQLSKNYTSHYSIFAGLTKAKGSCVTVIPDDDQQPYDILIEMYRLWENEHKVVIPYRSKREDPFISKAFSRLFYIIIKNLSIIDLPEGGADTFLIDRELVDIINEKIHPINTTSITEVLRLGFSPYFLPYTRAKSANEKSRWTFKKKLKLASDFFFSSSNMPIKVITRLGLFFSMFSLIIIGFYLYLKIFGDANYWQLNVPGWTSLIIIISFFSGLILFSLGIVAEYIWRIYEEVKARPGFIIKNDVDKNQQKPEL